MVRDKAGETRNPIANPIRLADPSCRPGQATASRGDGPAHGLNPTRCPEKGGTSPCRDPQDCLPHPAAPGRSRISWTEWDRSPPGNRVSLWRSPGARREEMVSVEREVEVRNPGRGRQNLCGTRVVRKERMARSCLTRPYGATAAHGKDGRRLRAVLKSGGIRAAATQTGLAAQRKKILPR